MKYLLIGGGLASSAAAQAIRAIDPRGELMMIGQEINRPYHRPPLSKTYLRTRPSRDELFTQPADWYAEHHVQLRTGLRATRLDAARRVVALENGQEISFDRLLIATGASPAHLTIPGADLPNIYYLRTLEEAERLHHAVEKALREGHPHKDGRGKVAIIGGGVLGVELAATMRQLNLGVDLIVNHAHPWHKFAGESTGRFLAKYLDDQGISLHMDTRPLRVEGDGRVQRVALDNGQSVTCDFVFAAIGAVTNREILRNSPVTSEKAILVDERCRTNIADIYAAGDCCAVFDPLFAKHRWIDHWDNAMVTGTIAGTNMAGGNARYDRANYFFSDVFDLSVQGWGEPRLVEHRLVRGNQSLESPDFVEIGIASDGRIAHVLAINHRGEDETLRQLVGRRVQVGGKEESLKDPATRLEDLLK